jgi:hypothetical protein
MATYVEALHAARADFQFLSGYTSFRPASTIQTIAMDIVEEIVNAHSRHATTTVF